MLASDIHIDDFFHDAAKTLVMLYNQFPRKAILYVEDISGPDAPDEFGLHSPRHQSCFHSLLWLAHADYINYEQLVRQEAMDQAVLTHRGFLVLSSPFPDADPKPDLPEGIALEETLTIHHLRDALKNGSSFTLAKVVRTVMYRSRLFCDQVGAAAWP